MRRGAGGEIGATEVVTGFQPVVVATTEVQCRIAIATTGGTANEAALLLAELLLLVDFIVAGLIVVIARFR